MDGDLSAMLVTACTAVKGAVTTEEFQATLRQTSDEAMRQANASRVVESIDAVIAACSHDSTLDAKAALWVVEYILKAKSVSGGSDLAQWFRAFQPHLVSWIKHCMLLQKSERGLRAVRRVVESWHQKGFLTANQFDDLQSALKKVAAHFQRSNAKLGQTAGDSLESSQSSNSQVFLSSMLKPSDTESNVPSEPSVGFVAKPLQASTEPSSQDVPPNLKRIRRLSQEPSPQSNDSQIPGAITMSNESTAKRSRRDSCSQPVSSASGVASAQILATQLRKQSESSHQIMSDSPQVEKKTERKMSLPHSPKPASNPRGSVSPPGVELTQPARMARAPPSLAMAQELTSPAKARRNSVSQAANQSLSARSQTSTLTPCNRDSQGSGTSSTSKAKPPEEGNPSSMIGSMPRPEIWKVYGDCRCLFRSICRACDDPFNEIERDAKGLPCAEKPRRRELMRADDLRAQVCLTMRKCRDQVEKMLGGEMDVEDYTRRMGQWQTWGDGICLSFLPDLIRRPIQVYAFNVERKCVFDSGMHMPRETSLHGEPAVVLWYNGKSHYDLVSTRWLMAWERSLYKTSETSISS